MRFTPKFKFPFNRKSSVITSPITIEEVLLPTSSAPKERFNQVDAPSVKARMLVAEAKRWVGIKEQGGDNSGQMVERFQRAVDGKAHGEPWCMSFAQFCIIAVDYLCGKMGIPDLVLASGVYKTEHCLTLWNKTPNVHRITNPEVGCLVIYQYYDRRGNPTSSGHVEIVTKIINLKSFISIGGNTGGPPGEVVREGDGVFQKTRSIRGAGRMKVKGFVRVWV